MDGLAKAGVWVERALTPTPSTGPAHASLLTGLYPWRHRVLENAVPMSGARVTLAERVREQGGATAAFVSSYILHPRFGFDQGFDSYVFDPTESYVWRSRNTESFWQRGQRTTDAAMSWLNEQSHAGSQRFFLWVHYFDPHQPYLPPGKYAVPASQPVDLTGKKVPKGIRGKAELRSLIRAYRGEVQYVDAQIGRLLERLHLLGLAETTAVIVTSDHGEGLGDHGVLQHGENLFDELVRIPLIASGPGIAPAGRLAGTAQLEDLYPTVLALLGIESPADLDGVDLLPWLSGEVKQSPREAALGRTRIHGSRPALHFSEAWPEKWIGTIGQKGRTYSLDSDPREAQGTPGAGMPDGLSAALATQGAGIGEEQRLLDPETTRALEALGYLDDAETKAD